MAEEAFTIWKLPENATLGPLAAKVLLDAKRVLDVIRTAASTVVLASTRVKSYDDLELLLAAGLKTTQSPGVWEIVGLAVSEDPHWSNLLSEMKNMPRVRKSMCLQCSAQCYKSKR
jgi:hypothetical protein